MEEAYGGECIGDALRIKSCNLQDCPLDCVWGEWTEGVCSATCGNGEKTRTRTKIQEEAYDGKCFGEDVMTESCNEKNCPIGEFK